jgi:RNA polymerase sigma-B factor
LQRRAGELRLARYARTRDASERDELVRRYMPLARSAAARYQHTSESFDDLLQVAAIGLLKAIDRYDPDRGYAFSSFAVPTILGELRRHLRDHTWTIRVPRDLQELGQRLRPATDDLAASLGRAPTVGELAAHLDVGEEEVLDARQALAAHSPTSLDAPTSDHEDGASLGELLGADDTALAGAENAVVLQGYLAKLPARNREILRLRFEEDLRQHEIGARLGLSQMHISRLIRQSLEQLRSFEPKADRTGWD